MALLHSQLSGRQVTTTSLLAPSPTVPAAVTRSACRHHQLTCNASSRSEGTESPGVSAQPNRREALMMALAGATLLPAVPAHAIQGLTAGRIPGISKTADEAGFYTYARPEGKSGGHGVGWSEIPQYSFKIPDGWAETPVSIADLGGTEIDLRYSSRDQGEIAVVVAPVLRFMDVGFNASITLKDIGNPDKVIAGFGPELFGKPLDEEDVLETEVETTPKGQLYYFWHLKPHNLVAATAVRNRVFILTVSANGRQWKKHESALRTIVKSFNVPDA